MPLFLEDKARGMGEKQGADHSADTIGILTAQPDVTSLVRDTVDYGGLCVSFCYGDTLQKALCAKARCHVLPDYGAFHTFAHAAGEYRRIAYQLKLHYARTATTLLLSLRYFML